MRSCSAEGIAVPLLCFLFCFISFSSAEDETKRVVVRNYTRLQLISAVGPESLAFDCDGEGPYTGVSDGRIFKWDTSNHAWVEFAVSSGNRRRDFCDGSNEPEMEYMCGRPLGLQFNKRTCDLYIADAYYGLLKVSRTGGAATRLASSADNMPFKFTNAVDIDPRTGAVYFTDSSIFFPRWAFALAVISGDKSGRLMKYDPRSQRVTVLLSGLRVANGVALSRNYNFILVAETAKNRVMRYWLEGPNARKCEVFAELPTFPDNIKRNDKGEFWVGLNNGRGTLERVHRHGNFDDGRYWDSLQSNSNITGLKSGLRSSTPLSKDAVAIKFNEEGEVLEVLNGEGGRALESVSEVEEYQGTLWIGSVVMPYVSYAKS